VSTGTGTVASIPPGLSWAAVRFHIGLGGVKLAVLRLLFVAVQIACACMLAVYPAEHSEVLVS